MVEEAATDVIAAAHTQGMVEHLAQAPLRFAPVEGVGVFEALGWKVLEIRSLLNEAIRFRRAPFFLALSGTGPAQPGQDDPLVGGHTLRAEGLTTVRARTMHRLSKRRFRWWPSSAEPAQTLQARRASFLNCAYNRYDVFRRDRTNMARKGC